MILDDMFCNFVKNKNSLYECAKCGNIISVYDEIEEPPILPCFAPIQNYHPGAIIDFMTEHNVQDLCTEGEIDSRHKICITCKFFNNNSCDKCGCALSKDRNYLNKLAVRTESCPINKW